MCSQAKARDTRLVDEGPRALLRVALVGGQETHVREILTRTPAVAPEEMFELALHPNH